MLDLQHEKPITLADAAATLPGKAAGGSVCYHTLFRWATKGIRGLRLETACVGNQRYTSAEAIQRFIRSLTAVRDDCIAPLADPRRQQPRVRRANHEAVMQRLQQKHGI